MAGHPVVALWMSGISDLIEVDPQFSVVVRRMKLGKSCKRPLLKPGCKDSTVVESNSVRRSCMALFLDDEQWPQDIVSELKQCKCILCYNSICEFVFLLLIHI